MGQILSLLVPSDLDTDPPELLEVVPSTGALMNYGTM